jgi:hypothetical protein
VSKAALEIPTGQDLHEREFPLIPVDKEWKPLVWSGLVIKHSYLSGLENVSILLASLIDVIRNTRHP